MRGRRYFDQLQTLRRFLVVCVIAFWLGGFAFYAGVVIHTGHRVFGSRVETGFLTQQVTGWINFSAVIALALLFVNVLIDGRRASRFTRAGLWLTWAIMAAILVKLYLMHPQLDAMLDMENQRVLSRAQFYARHRLYMNLSTTQWATGLAHTVLLLWAWRRADAQSHSAERC